MGKKKKSKQKSDNSGVPNNEPDSLRKLRELREENEMLRARLEKIAELAGELPGAPLLHDEDEEDEEDELRRDIDDEIADDEAAGRVQR